MQRIIAYLSRPSVLKTVFVAEVDSDEMILESYKLPNNAVADAHVGPLQDDTGGREGDVVTLELAQVAISFFVFQIPLQCELRYLVPFTATWHDASKAVGYRVFRVSSTDSVSEVPQDLRSAGPKILVQLFELRTEVAKNVLRVEESAAEECLDLKCDGPGKLSQPAMELVQLLRGEEASIEGLDIRPYGALDAGYFTQLREFTNVCLGMHDDAHVMCVRSYDGMGRSQAIQPLSELAVVFPLNTRERPIETFALQHRRGEEVEAYI